MAQPPGKSAVGDATPSEAKLAVPGSQVASRCSGVVRLTPLKIVLIVGSILLLATGCFGAGYYTRSQIAPTALPQVTITNEDAIMRGAGLLKIEEAAKALIMAGIPNASMAVNIELVVGEEAVQQSVNVKIGQIMDADHLPDGAIRYDMNDDGTGAFAMTIVDGSDTMDVVCTDSMRCSRPKAEMTNQVDGEDTGVEPAGALTGSSKGRRLWGVSSFKKAVSTAYHAQNKATNGGGFDNTLGPIRNTVSYFVRRPVKVVCWMIRRPALLYLSSLRRYCITIRL